MNYLGPFTRGIEGNEIITAKCITSYLPLENINLFKDLIKDLERIRYWKVFDTK